MQHPRPDTGTKRLQQLFDPDGTITAAWRAVWAQVEAGEEIRTSSYEALRIAVNAGPLPYALPSKADLRGMYVAEREASSDPAWVEAENGVRCAETERSRIDACFDAVLRQAPVKRRAYRRHGVAHLLPSYRVPISPSTGCARPRAKASAGLH